MSVLAAAAATLSSSETEGRRLKEVGELSRSLILMSGDSGGFVSDDGRVAVWERVKS